MLLLAGCTQDETPDASVNSLPPDTYPLQIASVTVAAEADGTQPQTRITDSDNASSWQDGDEIAVSMGGQTAVYSYNSTDKVWTSNAPLYWQNDEPQTVNAWYPVTDEIDFTQQNTKGLTYLLKAPATQAAFGTPITLHFAHQLAKVRVVLEGAKAQEVAAVTVRSYPTSAHTQGTLGRLDQSLTPQYVPMLKTQYDGQDCWEATLRNGTLQKDDSFKVEAEGGTPMQVVLDKDISIEAGKVYTININVEQAPKEIDLDTVTRSQLTVSGKTILKGDGQQKNLQITVEPNTELTLQDVNLSNQGSAPVVFKGDATLTLEGANTLEGECVAWDFASGSGIYIEQGTLTINADNENASLTISRKYNMKPNSSAGMGIHVPENASLIIKSGKITVNDVSSEGDSSGAGIGTSNETCGNITIEGGNITVGKCSYYTAGIGSLNGDCKGITITGENTVVNVSKGDYANYYIGSGIGTVTGNITIDGGATVNGVKYTETHTGPL